MILPYKGINIFYTDEGKGNTMVLLHGFLESSTIWHPIKSIFKNNYRVITIDLLGHGKTGCLGYVHSTETMAEAVQAVVDHLKVKKFTIIGHSMGGYVCMAFAEKNPGSLEGLVLMNSTAKADTEEKKKNRDKAIETVKKDHKSFIRHSISNLFRPKNRKIFTDEIKFIKEEAMKIPLQGIIAALEGMKTRKDREEILQNLACKKMIILGKKDPVIDYESLLNQMQNIDIEIVECPDGHMSYIENKNIVIQALKKNLKST